MARFPLGRLLLLLALASLAVPHAAERAVGARGPRASVLVQASSLAQARAAVEAVGGTITHELGVIHGVAADLTPAQAVALAHRRGLRLYGNRGVEVATWGTGDGSNRETYYPTLVGADRLHAAGVDGRGVTVAIIDTGLFVTPGLVLDPRGSIRVLDIFDPRNPNRLSLDLLQDGNGHGSHVASVLASSLQTKDGRYNGIAPAASLIFVKAFDEQGSGTYADVIRGIDWVLQNRGRYAIRVLNCSFSAPPRSHYWDDPLNQALMAAWAAGIVVVTSAGNLGPQPMSIGVPGNVPYLLTVGAMTDNYTPNDGSDDQLAVFSSSGPTYEGFVKPDLLAPGGHALGLAPKQSFLARAHREYADGGKYFTMSGTSQASAVVSGAAALLLQQRPGLRPDDVKCLLTHAARPAVKASGELAYSIYQQGAGLVNVYAASRATLPAGSCANRGLDIAADLAGTRHFGGRADRDVAGKYYLHGVDGYIWSDGYVWSDGYIWTDGYIWVDGYIWTDGYIWVDGYIWSDGGYVWTDGYIWTQGLTEPASTNMWVEPM